MSTGMPELGSKISLISKADIRYEGRLFTVDPQECTIALSSVRSFGTEDRETQCAIPAQNQVYDYILFRGSDIKDIRVLNNVPPQTLNDPAIMQLSVPPSLSHQQFGGHPVIGHVPVPSMGQYGGGFGAMAMAGMPSGLAPGMGIPNRSNSGTKPNIIGGSSRSPTPVSLHSHKSSGVDQSVQAGGAGGKKEDKKGGNAKQGQQKGSEMRRRGSSRSRERKDSRIASSGAGDGQEQSQNRNQNRSLGGPRNNYHQNYNYQQRIDQGYGGNNQQMRGGWIQRGPMRGRGGRARGGPGGFRPVNHNQSGSNLNQQAARKRNTLKFENDFDFEQANTEFEELRSQLAKVKIDEGSSTGTVKSEIAATPTVNGDSEKKEDSGNETGAGETEQEEDHEVFYDKKKSFFDKISCEAVERAKGKSQRTDWRQERKLNSETFGVAATRRGNFRGRSGFRGMGYRGGFRAGYRPQQQQQQRRDQGQGKVTYPILNYKPPDCESASDKQPKVALSPDTSEVKLQAPEAQAGIIDLTELIEACPGLGEGPGYESGASTEVVEGISFIERY
ncbi:hypothetical protein WA026_016389 [Henosepilachna vigintioctopunctata]|uniref:Uncharacterized protein n=1 Tax=Henosepilachna vigintioctopunctata TaxID=420089 RepID=A0AAW1UEV0_9CUCU